MMTIQRILVTGGTGFVGTNLTRVLLDSGYWATVLGNLSASNLEGLDLEFV